MAFIERTWHFRWWYDGRADELDRTTRNRGRSIQTFRACVLHFVLRLLLVVDAVAVAAPSADALVISQSGCPTVLLGDNVPT